MSREQSNFLKWFGGIAGSLTVAFIVGGIVMFRAVGVLGSDVKANRETIQDVKDNHERDVIMIYDYMRESREHQEKILETQKEILKELK